MELKVKNKLVIVLLALFCLQIVQFIISKNTNIYYQINQGGVFGIEINNFVVMILSIVAVIFVFFNSQNRRNLGLLLVLAGGLSNIIDRLLYGGVIDYIRILAFPIFNLADILITLGFVWYVFDTFIMEKITTAK